MVRTTGPGQSDMFGKKAEPRKVAKDSTRLTRAEFARLHDKSRSWTTQLVKRGVLVESVNDDGTINPHVANREIKAMDPAKSKATKQKKFSDAKNTGNGGAGSTPTMTIEQAMENISMQSGQLPDFETIKSVKEMHQARKLEIENRVRTGELVELSAVERSMFDMIRQLRDRILQIPDRVMTLVAAEHDPLKVRELLMAEYMDAIPDKENGNDPASN